jgi:hypothetical protein
LIFIDPEDYRFQVPSTNEDKRQLLLALCCTIFRVTEAHPDQPFIVSLLCYAEGYNDVQDQLIHAAYMQTNLANLNAVANNCPPLPAWAGSMADWDLSLFG